MSERFAIEPRGPFSLRAAADGDRYAQIAEAWRPFRTWATVLIRLHGDRAGWR